MHCAAIRHSLHQYISLSLVAVLHKYNGENFSPMHYLSQSLSRNSDVSMEPPKRSCSMLNSCNSYCLYSVPILSSAKRIPIDLSRHSHLLSQSMEVCKIRTLLVKTLRPGKRKRAVSSPSVCFLERTFFCIRPRQVFYKYSPMTC